MKVLISAAAACMFFIAPVFAEDAVSISQNLDAQWEHAFNAHNAAALASLYAPGAILLPAGVDRVLSRESDIRKYYDETVKQPISRMSVKTTMARMLGKDAVYGGGTWSADVKGQNGSSSHIMGTFLTVAVREGAEWKLRADTWNMMPPAKASQETSEK